MWTCSHADPGACRTYRTCRFYPNFSHAHPHEGIYGKTYRFRRSCRSRCPGRVVGNRLDLPRAPSATPCRGLSTPTGGGGR